jgi:hypothetical protein
MIEKESSGFSPCGISLRTKATAWPFPQPVQVLGDRHHPNNIPPRLKPADFFASSSGTDKSVPFQSRIIPAIRYAIALAAEFATIAIAEESN